MIYSIDVTTPKDTQADNYIDTVLKVTMGLVYKVEIDFPPGCAGLCHCSIYDGSYQCWPSSPRSTFHTGDRSISFDDIYLKLQPPFHFTIRTYNLDDTYSHTLNVSIGMVSQEIFMARFLPTMAYDIYVDKLKEAQAEQEALARQQRLELLKQPFPGFPT